MQAKETKQSLSFKKKTKVVHRLFGTDGVRGRANAWPMTPDVILKLAMVIGRQFARGNSHCTVVIGKDTRRSGYMVETALTSGFVAVGMDVVLLGPVPTPAVGMLTRSLRADLGVMISASHNPAADNGIKFFGPDGFKLSDEQEFAIETSVMADDLTYIDAPHIGKARRLDDASGRYIEFVKGTFPRLLRLDGLKIVVDCAHGAAYKVAPTVFWELGAEVITMGDQPDGSNINDGCGATHLAPLQAAVLEHKAHLGIALDGDADRLIMVDENGKILDGDYLLALIASSWSKNGRLINGGIVSTQMANLGLERYLQAHNLKLIRVPVGDRYVVELMRQQGYNVGGEPSGHIILNDYTTTGDSIIAALQILAVLVESNKPASFVGQIFEAVPQVMRSIRFNKADLLNHPSVRFAIQTAEKQLRPHGRLLVRNSGTEPLIRVMGQGDDEAQLKTVIDDIIMAIQDADHKVG